jgi:hypothetical protein
MKRIAMLCTALALAGASVAEAQLTMQMSNGWTFSFAGNVNAFYTYQSVDDDGGTVGGLTPAAGESSSRIRTGLLPAFAVLDAKGKEGNTDLGVHFGFAPQIQIGRGLHDRFDVQSAGASIDMRQVYLTVGGTWGSILAGRELGLFNRQNILNDQTLFGVGGVGDLAGDVGSGTGTTLGRIGFGYAYPNFVAQLTYSTPAGRAGQLSIGLFEAAALGDVYSENELPRVEAEGSYTTGRVKLWLGGLVQQAKTGGVADESATSFGGSAGFRFGTEMFSLTGSGFYGQGIGPTLLFSGAVSGTPAGTGTDDLRDAYGFIGQVTFTPANSKVTLAGSYGSSFLENADNEGDFKIEDNLISGGIYFQATKSLKVVGEFNYQQTKDDIDGTDNNKAIIPAAGFMLFF